MKVIMCLDDRNGYAFNHRRQSQDKIQREKMMERVQDSLLYMSSYSAKLFESLDNIKVSDTYLDEVKENDYCFVELEDLSFYEDKIKQFIIYRWNRTYPYDKQMTFDLSSYQLIETNEFAGSSHEKITEEIYINE